MVAAERLSSPPPKRWAPPPVLMLRIAIAAVLLAGWELLSASGWLYRDVVPSLPVVAKAIAATLSDRAFYFHLHVTLYEIFLGLAIGGLSGMAVGILLGANRLVSRMYEPYLYYLGPTPKIIFFPVMIMLFGIGSGSKIAMGAFSCFIPVALSAAGGMRQIDRVLIRVGHSFRASTWQMVTKIYLPAMRYPVLNGARLGFGVALIGTLLAETKLSGAGIGFMIIDAYSTFNMPRMYSLLTVLFILAIALNEAIGRWANPERIRR
jgi:ABC-type nitrate/sulfonate/bicarbonate transport system permease component